jgi:hypothetical protein
VSGIFPSQVLVTRYNVADGLQASRSRQARIVEGAVELGHPALHRAIYARRHLNRDHLDNVSIHCRGRHKMLLVSEVNIRKKFG